MKISARLLYSLVLYLTVPLLLLHLVWRGLANRGYWRRWNERFSAYGSTPAGPFALWIHAVSVGEVQTAIPLVKRLHERLPGLRTLVTTTTPTGSDRVREGMGEMVDHVYLPYDLPGAVGRFLERVRPDTAVLMETELWPNLFHQCAEKRVPLVVANARLSERSARGYRRFGPLTRQMLARVHLIAAQSPADAERFMALGVPPDRLRVTGNVKFDVRMPASLQEQAQVLRRGWGVDRNVWIAASTHDGEEELVLEAFQRVLAEMPGTLLLLVPRHPERFPRAAALAQRKGLVTAFRTESPAFWDKAQVMVGDTMGELPCFYAASDVAFVGGSLVPHGGHNMLEAAALGVPVILGPHLFNFSEASRLLLERDAARSVSNADELADTVLDLLRNPNSRHALGERGREVVEENRGALDRLTDLVAGLIGDKSKGLSDGP